MDIERLARLREELVEGRAVCAGVLSGTSADGIDVALVRPSASFGPPELLAFRTLPFEAGLDARLRSVLDLEPCTVRELALLSRDLGRAFGAAVRTVSADSGHDVDLVGSHGQTVYHHDGNEASGAATLQIGDGDHVAAAAFAPTVSDFRQADIAAGGEGAPLSALTDDELFADLARPACILNLGGISNLTVLVEPLLIERREADQALIQGGAFDAGPAGALLDGLARDLLGAPMDRDGRHAARGRAHAGLVEEFVDHPFLRRSPPKSTGRDTFGPGWVSRFIARGRELSLGPEDLLASGVALAARCVADALDAVRAGGGPRPARLVLCGGGAHNPALALALERATGLETSSSEIFGVSSDAREALCFALLAKRFVLGHPSSSTRVTGAQSGRVLGKFSWS